MITKQIELHNLKHCLDNIVHCGDYGFFYLKKDMTKVFLVLGDADNPDLTNLEKLCKSYGLEIETEAEYGPEDEDDYILISKGIEAECYDQDYEDVQEGYIIPKFISIEDYVDFYGYMSKLKRQ